MIPTARVQRGPSEAARCASTGIVPATPPLFSILLEEGIDERRHRRSLGQDDQASEEYEH